MVFADVFFMCTVHAYFWHIELSYGVCVYFLGCSTESSLMLNRLDTPLIFLERLYRELFSGKSFRHDVDLLREVV